MNKFIFVSMVLIGFGCGSDEPKYVKYPEPPPSPTNPGGSQKTSFTEARQIMGQYCESCHANSPWLQDDVSLRASSVKARTQNNSMPPQTSSVRMPTAARQRLLNFF